ncbi:hypothetical protein HPB50_009231 [Hyalomma asiaticum]|uniref:Uncharacterized protein n=1 Tax=Hyalomma asiaticum TaxID=266040 RepID=A0ACB7T6S3_HYAAI|nr:hypothetical protein HPB50_009231 [Hyalomma asiaticum]
MIRAPPPMALPRGGTTLTLPPGTTLVRAPVASSMRQGASQQMSVVRPPVPAASTPATTTTLSLPPKPTLQVQVPGAGQSTPVRPPPTLPQPSLQVQVSGSGATVRPAKPDATVARLSSTKAGLKILDEAGIAVLGWRYLTGFSSHETSGRIFRSILFRAIFIQCTMQAIVRLEPGLFFGVTRRAFGISVVDGKGQLVARASVCTDQVTVAEEIAIALALQAAEVPCVVYSDSRSAVRTFSGGLVSQKAARLLRSGRRQARWAGGHHISWFRAHVEGIDGVNPNASAHTLARECTNHAGGGEASGASGGNIDLRKDPLTTFLEITTSYKLSMRRFPLANVRLNRAQGITFRLLQTDT